MNNLNSPIYRAKKINSDEYIVSATIREDYKNDWKEKINGEWEDNKRCFLDMWDNKEKKWTEIDETTLSISFSDMLDSKGNKIFASLSEDGKGGDIMKWIHSSKESTSGNQAYFKNGKVCIDSYSIGSEDLEMSKYTVIEIQK